MDLSSFSKQNKELLSMLALVLLVVLLDLVFLLPLQWRGFAALKSQMQEIKQKKADMDADVGRIDTFRARLEELTAVSEKKNKAIIREDDIPALMEELSRISASVNLKILQIRPQKGKDNAENISGTDRQYYILSLSLLARGDYHSFGRFTDLLEKSDYMIEVKNIDIMPKDDKNQHDLKLSLSVYILETEL